MIPRFNGFLNALARYKYPIVIILGVVFVGFLSENSGLRALKLELQISELNSEIEKYTTQFETDSAKLDELNRHPKSIEKIAREQYFMKADDEDIFVLSDDEKPNQIENEAAN